MHREIDILSELERRNRLTDEERKPFPSTEAPRQDRRAPGL